jgi:hypothetical protein
VPFSVETYHTVNNTGASAAVGTNTIISTYMRCNAAFQVIMAVAATGGPGLMLRHVHTVEGTTL